MGTNILLCGDSISKGIIYDSISNKYKKCEAAFTGVLEKIFSTNILNISKFGNTVTRAEKRFYHTFSQSKPDVVIFGLGGNDCDFNWDEVAKTPEESHYPNTDIIQFSKSLSEMSATVRKEGKRPILMNLVPLDPDNYFKWITHNDEDRKKSILKWLGNVSKIYWWQERYSSAVQQVAKNQDIELIDIRTEFLKKYDFRNSLCEDGIHPNDIGQKVIATAIEKHFGVSSLR